MTDEDNQNPDAEFDNAFDTDTPVDSGAAVTTPDDDDGTPPEGGAGGDGQGGEGGEGGTGGKPDKTGTAGAAGAETVESLRQQLADLEQKTKSWDGRLRASSQREKELEAKLAEALAAKSTEQVPGDDDLENDPEIKKALEEFPDVVKPILKALKKQSSKTATSGDAVKPVADKVDKLLLDQHIKAITDVHADALDVVQTDEFKDWVESLPAYIQPGVKQTLVKGTSDEVITMLNDYKKATKPADGGETRGADGKTDAERAAETKQKEADAKRKKQLEDAGAVRTRSGGPPEGEADAGDFDGAWNDAPE